MNKVRGWFGWWLLLGALLPAATARGQSFSLEHDRQPIVSLDGLWRFQPGDDPRWAEPGFDDSGWKLLRSDRSWSDQGYPALSGYAWYRFTVELPEGSGATAVLLQAIVSGYEVFVDGKRVGGVGSAGPTSTPVVDFRSHLFAAGNADKQTQRTLHVAIRVWQWPAWVGYEKGGILAGGSVAGDASLLATEQRQRQTLDSARYVDSYVEAVAAALIGLIVFGLFLLRRGEREYFWFAALLLLEAVDKAGTGIFHTYYGMSFVVFDVLDGIVLAAYEFSLLCFFSTVLRVRGGIGFRICGVLLTVSGLSSLSYWWNWTSVPASAAIQIACMVPTICWILTVLVRGSLKGDPDARLLLVPTVLVQGATIWR